MVKGGEDLTILKDFLMGGMSGICFKEFCKEPEIRLSDWTEGNQWGLLGKKILIHKKDDKSLQTCDEYFSFLNNLNKDCFEELMTKIFAVNYIKFESSNWKFSVCRLRLVE